MLRMLHAPSIITSARFVETFDETRKAKAYDDIFIEFIEADSKPSEKIRAPRHDIRDSRGRTSVDYRYFLHRDPRCAPAAEPQIRFPSADQR